MAQPLTPSQILAALRSSGLDVYEMPGWRDRCRCHNGSHERGESPSGRAWGAWNGVTLHITAGAALGGQAAINYTSGILIGGNGVTPGPLCMAGIDADGRIILVSAGRANHIGSISQASLDAMTSASFSLSGYDDKRGHGVDGNTHTLGFEILQPGVPNPAQRDAAVRAAAALSRAAGWTGQEVHGHGECSDQRGYSDPGLDMGAVRRDVMALVRNPASTPTLPEPTIPQEEDMLALILWCYAALVGRTNPPSVSEVENWISGTPGWTAARVLDAFLNAPCEPGGVVKAYADFLGRAPESQAVIDQRLTSKPTVRQVRLDVASGPEAKQKA